MSFTLYTKAPNVTLKRLQINGIKKEQSGLGAQVWMCWCSTFIGHHWTEWTALSTQNCLFHTTVQLCSLGQHRSVPLQRLTLAYKGFLQQVRWRQRRKLKPATSALQSNSVRNLHLCSVLCCLKRDWESSFQQWWSRTERWNMQYCRFKIKSKKVEGKLGKITFVSGKDVVGSL